MTTAGLATIRIERCVPGGDGLGRLPDGRVVFVSGAFPEDLVEVQELSEHKGYTRATRWQLGTASPHRRTPTCPFAARCGGCDWMEIDERAQQGLKLELVEDALRRVGKLPPGSVELGWVAGAQWGYRSRLRLHLSATGELGLHGRSSHGVVPITHCAVSSPELNEALRSLRDSLQALSEGDRRTFAANFSEIELRCLGPRSELFLHRQKGSKPRQIPAVEGFLSELRVRFAVSLDDGRAAATQPQPVRLAVTGSAPREVSLLTTPGVFTQVNWEINQDIVGHLLEGAAQRGLKNFVDLFCGVGNFSIPLLAAGLDGRGVEGNASAIECARAAAQQLGKAAHFEVGDVARAARRLASEKRKYDLVLVDPPRAGAARAVDDIAALCDGHVFYCACDPVSFARDLRRLLELGFELEELTAFDMFPQTHHVELVAWFCRPKTGAGGGGSTVKLA